RHPGRRQAPAVDRGHHRPLGRLPRLPARPAAEARLPGPPHGVTTVSAHEPRGRTPGSSARLVSGQTRAAQGVRHRGVGGGRAVAAATLVVAGPAATGTTAVVAATAAAATLAGGVARAARAPTAP